MRTRSQLCSRPLPPHARALLGAALLAAPLSATGCKTPAAEPAASPEEGQQQAQAAEPGAPNTPWDQKTKQQRQEFMGIYVFPKMKQVFQGKNAETYAEFKCQTCHGDDMEAVGFKMPNDLYPLPTENTIEAAKEYDAETTQFMMEQVVPTMVDVLGVKPYDPSTGEGFGCFSCHPKE